MGWGNKPGRHILGTPPLKSSYQQNLGIRTQLIKIAQAQLRVRETTGKNDGGEVEQYLAYTGHAKGAPWCAAFVSWVYGKAGLPQPKTAWSPALFPSQKRTASPLPADVFGIYFPSLKRIAHCGLVETISDKYIIGIEGNTNVKGAREGDGVYRKRRHRREISAVANWIDPVRKEVRNAP